MLPFNVIMRNRDPSHYMNINPRIEYPISTLQTGKEVICLRQNIYGIIGTLESINLESEELKVTFNKSLEESKIHDPFISHNFLKNMNNNPGKNLKKYFTDRVIEN